MSRASNLGVDLDHDDLQNRTLQRYFECTTLDCGRRFKRRGHLERHLGSHCGKKSYVCWVPDCYRRFSRRDNLHAHYTTHGTRRGRNRYVSTFDETSADYNPNYRGALAPDGLPLIT